MRKTFLYRLLKKPDLSLRQTLFMGAGAGILLPALLLAYFQITTKLETEINLRVRVPMQQYADVLASGVAVAIWNVDRAVATELVEAVMRNPDVISVTVTDEYKEVFVRKQSSNPASDTVLREERTVLYNGSRVGQLAIELTTTRTEKDLRDDLLKLVASLFSQVGISFALIWLLFDHRIVRPLRELKEGALRLAKGSLDQPLHWHRRDEIGSLAGGLDMMRANLAALLSERDQKNAALEQELAERLRTEKALSLSQDKFSAIFDASPVAMTVSKMGGDFAVRDLNAAWSSLFGRDRKTMLGTSGETNGLWKSQADRRDALTSLAQTGAISRRPAWFHGASGQPDVLCEISGKVIALGDEPLLILSYEDITAKHHYDANILALNASLEERVSQRTQELSSALDRLTATQTELIRTEKMAALGSLVAGIAHELNTPIGNSLTVASTLQDQTKAFTDAMAGGITRSRLGEYVATTQEGAGILMRSLRHAADLVSSFKQVAVDQTSVNRRRFNLRETVQEILLTLGPVTRKTSHTVECDIPADISLESYPGPLGQIITNLINNALVHAFESRKSGHILISANHQDDDDRVTLTVRDNGVGIPPMHLSRVFDPFFTTKLGKGGSGLGLSIVFNLVQDVLGGTITVESIDGRGACFILSIPVAAPTSQPNLGA
jgi:signal transduction histidine kinase